MSSIKFRKNSINIGYSRPSKQVASESSSAVINNTASKTSNKRVSFVASRTRSQNPTVPTPPPLLPTRPKLRRVTPAVKKSADPLAVSSSKKPQTSLSSFTSLKGVKGVQCTTVTKPECKDACVETETHVLFADLLYRVQEKERKIIQLNAKVREMEDHIESLMEIQLILNPPCPTCTRTSSNSGSRPSAAPKDNDLLTVGATSPAPLVFPVTSGHNLQSPVNHVSSTPAPEVGVSVSSASDGKRRLLVVGDSMSRDIGSALQTLLPDFLVTCCTHPGSTFAQIIQNLSSLTSSFNKRDFVFIQGGTNDVPYFYPSLISELLESIRDVCNRTEVIVSAVPYMYHREGKDWNSNIFATNLTLLRMSSTFKFHLFNCNHSLSRTMYTKHGLHLNHRGKLRLSEILTKFVLDMYSRKILGRTAMQQAHMFQLDESVLLCDETLPLSESGAAFTTVPVPGSSPSSPTPNETHFIRLSDSAHSSLIDVYTVNDDLLLAPLSLESAVGGGLNSNIPGSQVPGIAVADYPGFRISAVSVSSRSSTSNFANKGGTLIT
uniref:Uncharacterized protein n=1 Tax=Cacopsylla melanoneura TaxID=428564 RepID=A0A8D8QRV3_9HEMI